MRHFRAIAQDLAALIPSPDASFPTELYLPFFLAKQQVHRKGRKKVSQTR